MLAAIISANRRLKSKWSKFEKFNNQLGKTMTFKKVFYKPTLISISGFVLLLIGIPSGIYGLTLDGGASLGGALILVATFVIFLVLLIDRALVKRIAPLRLSIYELIFLIVSTSIYFYSQRKIIVDIKDSSIDFLLIIENPGNLTNNETQLEFPFNKRISTNESIVIVDNMTKNIDFNINAGWNKSYYYNRYEFDKYPKVKFFCKTSLDFKRDISENLIDSLMNK